jgi:hypothetical protein
LIRQLMGQPSYVRSTQQSSGLPQVLDVPMDKPLPPDFDLAKHYGDAAYDGRYDDQDNQDDDGDGRSTYEWPERPGCKPTPEITKFAHGTSMYERILDFALSLIALPRNPSAAESRRHALALSVAVVMIYGYIAISCGAFQSIGISGFAKATDLSALREQTQNENTEVRVILYGIAIRDLYRSCRNATDEQDRLALNGQLQDIRAKYEKATRVPYLLPPCIESR